jgi:hypothetical protein
MNLVHGLVWYDSGIGSGLILVYIWHDSGLIAAFTLVSTSSILCVWDQAGHVRDQYVSV